jgi:predicted RNA-binding protein associated with RNAse of E/G family
VHTDARWFGGRLMLAELGASHSVYVSWGEGGEFVGWYVNLEDPWRGSPYGFDTTDHFLDIWVEPDRSWRWKDENHLAEAVDLGLFTAAQAKAMRAEGERVIDRIESSTGPFDEGWENWLPDPAWPLPTIPEGWDRL